MTMVENPTVGIDILNKMSSELKWKTELYPMPVVVRSNKEYDPELKRMMAILSLCVKNNAITQKEMDHYIKTVKDEEEKSIYLQITSWFSCGIKPNCMSICLFVYKFVYSLMAYSNIKIRV